MANFEIINKCICSAMLLILISDSLVLADVNFVSVPTTIKTFENDSVLLPCYSKGTHIGHYEKKTVDIVDDCSFLMQIFHTNKKTGTNWNGSWFAGFMCL